MNKNSINELGEIFTFYKNIDDDNIFVKTDDEKFTLIRTTYDKFIDCRIYKPTREPDSRIGLTYKNNKGELMTIVKYNDSSDIYVEFNDNNKAIVHTTFNNFKKGEVNNPYRRSYYSKGYVGIGFKPTRDDKSMMCWSNMLKRCYNENYRRLHPTYNECYVCDEWLNFQNFHVWYNDNFYKFDDYTMCLDKDIIVKGNKLYSPDTAIFVPQFINKLFTRRDNDRGPYPIGVTKNHNRFYASCSFYDIRYNRVRNINLGSFETAEEAFYMYKNTKEENIRNVADLCKGKVPERLIKAMYDYKVEITD